MKVAIIGSRGLAIDDFSPYLPPDTDEILSGGAAGIDTCARRYAERRGIPLSEYLPDYARYKRAAPLRRNMEIIAAADTVVAFWDGASRGTKYVIEQCRKLGKPIRVYEIRK